jgi:hypothetical protein
MSMPCPLYGYAHLAYLFRRRIMRSGVAASSSSFGALFFASLATDFSEAGGMLVAPVEGAPGSAAGSDIAAMTQ